MSDLLGWTAAELEAAPVIARLHSRILDLEDARERVAICHPSDIEEGARTAVKHKLGLVLDPDCPPAHIYVMCRETYEQSTAR